MTNKPSAGQRAKTRNKYKSRGIITINKILKEFNKGDSVQIVINGNFHRGMPYRRYHGLVGVVQKARGNCYEVSVRQVGAKKEIMIVAHPVHLKSIGVAK